MSAWGYCQSVKRHMYLQHWQHTIHDVKITRTLFFDILVKLQVGHLISEYLPNLIFLALSRHRVFKSEVNQKKMDKEIPGFYVQHFSLVIIEIKALIKWVAFKVVSVLEGKGFCKPLKYFSKRFVQKQAPVTTVLEWMSTGTRFSTEAIKAECNEPRGRMGGGYHCSCLHIIISIRIAQKAQAV